MRRPPTPAGAASLMSRRHAWLRSPPVGPPLQQSLALAHRGRATDVPASGSSGSPPCRAAGTTSTPRPRWPRSSCCSGCSRCLRTPPRTLRQPGRGAPTCAASPSTSGRALVPSRVRLTALVPDAGPLAERLERAERDYRGSPSPAGDGISGGRAPRAAHPRGPGRRHVVGRPARGRGGGRADPPRRAAARVVLPDLRAARLRRVRRLPAGCGSSATRDLGVLPAGRPSAARAGRRSGRRRARAGRAPRRTSAARTSRPSAPASTSSHVRGAATRGQSPCRAASRG